ncbi:MAG: ketol-acid reductoisomerase [Dehalococcoidales bacterium]|nr:ketol-acid reductoisomerase [Dehalococcoidales bacterium]
MAIIDFGGVKEEVITREEFPMEKAREVLKNEVIAIIGYGVQGPGQALNLKDNGFKVIIGQSKQFPEDWQRAVNDGWKPGVDLFEIDEAAKRGTVIEMLVADAAQPKIWPVIKKNLKPGKALYFSHGFSIVYKDQTKIIPPPDVDVIMVAPKGSGTSLRRNFLSGAGINASFAIYQDATGRARERCLALGIGIGAGYLFPTTFEKEVYSDLVGERGVLMGALAGIMEAQYEVLRKHGHSPSEAFNETVEELTESLIKLVAENGMDWMYANCSATAQRGALDWKPKFKKAVMPLFERLYERVASGAETRRVLRTTGRPDYKQQLARELAEMGNSEMWLAGKATRALRPKEPQKADVKAARGTAGRQITN